jgi:hypothetical protein
MGEVLGKPVFHSSVLPVTRAASRFIRTRHEDQAGGDQYGDD